MIIFFYINLDHSEGMRFVFRNKIVNFLGAMVWPCYMITPLVYMFTFSSVSESVLMTMLGNCVLGMGGILITFVVAVIFIFLVQFPIDTFINLAIRNKLDIIN